MDITLPASSGNGDRESDSGPAGRQTRTFSLFNPPLEMLAQVSEENFRRSFTHSPIKRPKYIGWLRNLCVVMGNSGDRQFLPRLEELSRHDDPVVREHAEWALGQLVKG